MNQKWWLFKPKPNGRAKGTVTYARPAEGQFEMYPPAVSSPWLREDPILVAQCPPATYYGGQKSFAGKNLRRLTIVIDVDQDTTDHRWFYDSHLKHQPMFGVHVRGIAEGDLIKEVEELEQKIEGVSDV